MSSVSPSAAIPAVRPFFEVSDLKRDFILNQRKGWFGPRYRIRAVDGVSFSLKKGEALGIVGESGCGKSSVAKVILNIYPPQSGHIHLDGVNLTTLDSSQWKSMYRKIQYVFQDPLGALDPRMTILEQVIEPLTIHFTKMSAREKEGKARTLLDAVGMRAHLGMKYPHELSGGQRQRVVIARALVLDPEVLICDEPISALDVSIQAQVVNLLAQLRKERNISLLFISHDLSMVKHLCDRVAVMYMGKIVEIANTKELFASPAHPYTRALLASIPIPDPSITRTDTPLMGEPPSVIHPPSGCRFHPRCTQAQDLCSRQEPSLEPINPDKGKRKAACHCLDTTSAENH